MSNTSHISLSTASRAERVRHREIAKLALKVDSSDLKVANTRGWEATGSLARPDGRVLMLHERLEQPNTLLVRPSHVEPIGAGARKTKRREWNANACKGFWRPFKALSSPTSVKYICSDLATDRRHGSAIDLRHAIENYSQVTDTQTPSLRARPTLV